MSQIILRTVRLIVCTAFAIGVFGGPQPRPTQAASHVPSVEITGLPNTTSCTISEFMTVPVYYNTTALAFDRGQLVVNGQVEASTSQKHDPGQGSANYDLSGASPTTFDVPYGTYITIIIITYYGPDEADGKAFESVLVYTCGAGTIVSLNQTADPSETNGDGVGPDMITLPPEAVVGTFTTPTALYFMDDAAGATPYVMITGQSLWVLGINEARTFYQVVLSGKMYWVPVSNIGPTYDDVWYGTPLPITVVG